MNSSFDNSKPSAASAAEHVEAIESMLYCALFGAGVPYPAYGVLEGLVATSPSAVGLKSSWGRNDPQAMQRDFDSDGIPDALDGHFGPGAVDPVTHI